MSFKSRNRFYRQCRGYHKTDKKEKAEIPIIVVCDSGFLDDKAFTYFEETLKIGYVITGKMYDDIKNYIEKVAVDEYKKFKGSGIWNYLEFGNVKEWVKSFFQFVSLQNENPFWIYILI